MRKLIAPLGLAAAGLGLVVSVAISHTQGTAHHARNPFFGYSAATGNIEPEGKSPAVDAKLLEHGHWVYRGLCIGCHGIKGDGNGAVWELGEKYAKSHKLPRQPRDFTSAVFKVRSTPSGSLPTDTDLFKAISRGLVADQDMPSFKYLPERDRWAVIGRGVMQLRAADPVAPRDYYELTDAGLRGHEIYRHMGCNSCHRAMGTGEVGVAPVLDGEGTRRSLAWLDRYFENPQALVPATAHDGSLGPDFRQLPAKDRRALTAFLFGLKANPGSPNHPTPPLAHAVR